MSACATHGWLLCHMPAMARYIVCVYMACDEVFKATVIHRLAAMLNV